MVVNYLQKNINIKKSDHHLRHLKEWAIAKCGCTSKTTTSIEQPLPCIVHTWYFIIVKATHVIIPELTDKLCLLFYS